MTNADNTDYFFLVYQKPCRYISVSNIYNETITIEIVKLSAVIGADVRELGYSDNIIDVYSHLNNTGSWKNIFNTIRFQKSTC